MYLLRGMIVSLIPVCLSVTRHDRIPNTRLSICRLQASYVRKLGLAGAFIWSVELDDFAGICNQGKYPLLSTIARILRSDDERSAGGFDGGFIRHDNNRNPAREARPRYDALPAATTSPSRLSRGHSEARRAFSLHIDDHRRAHNFGNYEKASESDERYGEDSLRHDDRLKATTSYSDQREETPDQKYQRKSRADYGSTAVRRQRPRLGGEGSTPRQAGSSRYFFFFLWLALWLEYCRTCRSELSFSILSGSTICYTFTCCVGSFSSPGIDTRPCEVNEIAYVSKPRQVGLNHRPLD